MPVGMCKSVKSAMTVHRVAKTFKDLTASRAVQAGNPTEYGIQEIRDANRNLASTAARDILLKLWSIVVERDLNQRIGFQKILLVHRLDTSAKADLIAGFKLPVNGPIDELENQFVRQHGADYAKLCCKRGESKRAKEFAADFARKALIQPNAPDSSVEVTSGAPTSSSKSVASSNAADRSDPPQQTMDEVEGSLNVEPTVSKSRNRRIRKRKRGSEQEPEGDAKISSSASSLTPSSVPLVWNGIPDQVEEPESYTETGPGEPLPKKQRSTWYGFPSASLATSSIDVSGSAQLLPRPGKKNKSGNRKRNARNKKRNTV